jgi:transcriptional repressor NrdR
MGETEVKAETIGSLIMEALYSLDQVAYVRFASVYRNFREAKDFENFIIDELSAEDESV